MTFGPQSPLGVRRELLSGNWRRRSVSLSLAEARMIGLISFQALVSEPSSFAHNQRWSSQFGVNFAPPTASFKNKLNPSPTVPQSTQVQVFPASDYPFFFFSFSPLPSQFVFPRLTRGFIASYRHSSSQGLLIWVRIGMEEELRCGMT